MIVLRHHPPGPWLGFFGLNVVFRPPLGTLPNSISNFQVSDMGDRLD